MACYLAIILLNRWFTGSVWNEARKLTDNSPTCSDKGEHSYIVSTFLMLN